MLLDNASESGNLVQRKGKLEEGLRSKFYDINLWRDYVNVLRQLGYSSIAQKHAEFVIGLIKTAMVSELKTGMLDPKYGLENVFAAEDPHIVGLFGQEGGSDEQTLSQCIANLNKLRKMEYPNTNWDHIRGVLAGYTVMNDLAESSEKLLHAAHEDSTRDKPYVTHDSLNFLDKCIQSTPGLNSFDVGDALEFFADSRGAFGGGQQTTIDNLVTFFTKVKRYDDEVAIIVRYSIGGSRVRHVVDSFRMEKFGYVLGTKPKVESNVLASKTTESQAQRYESTQMVSQILEQNALKCFLGYINYAKFIRALLGRNEDDQVSFFHKLCPAYITEEQLHAVETFITGFDIERIPIHEYRHPSTTRNTNFEARIDLGNAGILRTFIKLYTSIEGEKNAQREKFLLEGKGKEILEKYHVQVPPALASCPIELKNHDSHNALLLYFINARTLDEIVNGPQPAPRELIDQIVHNATTELARVHKSTNDLEVAAKSEGVTLFDVGSEYFERDLESQLKVPYNNVPWEIGATLLAASRNLCQFLAAESDKDGVYYKDSNSRNIFGPTEGDGVKVTLLDYECGAKILGEVDLMKIMRNGCHFEFWLPNIDYTSSEWNEESRKKAEAWVSSKRYFPRDNESEVIRLYNIERDKQYDPEAIRRFDMASLYTHIWYVAWFSHKMREEDISDKSRCIIGNRVNYHLMEAKLMVDEIIHDKLRPYLADEPARQQFLDSMGLPQLRKSLDNIPLNT